MADENLFINDQNPQSLRFAVIEDDGNSAWLYLTECDSPKPVADVWLYNRIPAPPMEDIQSYRGGPPPAARGYVSDSALCMTPKNHEWRFLWSTDRESVAVTRDGVPVACIVAGQKRGYSRELNKDGPWGNTWSDELYDEIF
ncbi:MAG: hypothetical protein ACYS67_19825 [Planctomycetota bacterium]|jgi:hypothetical protein